MHLLYYYIAKEMPDMNSRYSLLCLHLNILPLQSNSTFSATVTLSSRKMAVRFCVYLGLTISRRKKIDVLLEIL
jgi:hypothetical protein